MARNCHKSVFNALSLGNISPVYVYPSIVEGYGISGAVEPDAVEKALDENPDAEAVILPSPNYYGICSDIKAIGEKVHSRGKILIVDQAHGAHLKFFSRFTESGLPVSAEESGADAVINSTHKTLASFTQSAVLNVNSQRIDRYVLEDKLQAVESTSPSYLLMASLDINAEIIGRHGREIFEGWKENLDFFYKKAAEIQLLRVMEVPEMMDVTKINMDMSDAGISGEMLEKKLTGMGVFPELYTGNILMCMTGMETAEAIWKGSLRPLKRLRTAQRAQEGRTEPQMSQAVSYGQKKRPAGELRGTKILMEIERCDGMTCAYPVIPYPPGIPLVCAGEKIDSDDIAYIKELRAGGEKVIGIDEKNRIAVVI